MNDWMTLKPGKTLSIYNVAKFAQDAVYAAFIMNNITSDSKNTKTWPVNSNIFLDEDSLPAVVTNQPQSPT